MAQAKAAAVKEYVVTAPYVTVKTMTIQGVRVVGLMEGAPLPADVPERDLKHLLDQGLAHERGWQPPSPEDEAIASDAGMAAAQLANAQAGLDKAQKQLDDAKAAVDRFNQAAADQKATAEAGARRAANDAAEAARIKAEGEAAASAEAEAEVARLQADADEEAERERAAQADAEGTAKTTTGRRAGASKG